MFLFFFKLRDIFKLENCFKTESKSLILKVLKQYFVSFKTEWQFQKSSFIRSQNYSSDLGHFSEKFEYFEAEKFHQAHSALLLEMSNGVVVCQDLHIHLMWGSFHKVANPFVHWSSG